MPRDSLKVVAVPRPRSGAALMAAAISVGLHAVIIAVFWGRPFIDMESLASRLGAVLGVELLSPEDAPPAKALPGAPRPRDVAVVPPGMPKEMPAGPPPSQMPGPESISLPEVRPRADSGRGDRSVIEAPRTPAATRAVRQLEADLATGSGPVVGAPARRKLSGRLGPPAAVPSGQPGRPGLSPPAVPPAEAGPIGGGETKAPLGSAMGPGSAGGPAGAATLAAPLTPPVTVKASAVDAGELGRWILFEITPAEAAGTVPAGITVVLGAPAGLDAAASEAVRAAALAAPRGSTLRFAKGSGAGELRRGSARSGEGAWVLALSGPVAGNDLAEVQGLLGALAREGAQARVAVIEVSPSPSYALGWLARRTGGTYRHVADAASAAGAAGDAVAEIASAVFDPAAVTGSPVVTVPAAAPAVIAGRSSRLYLKAEAPGARALLVLRGRSGPADSTLPLAAPAGLKAAGIDAAKTLAIGEIDRLLEFAARTGLSDEARARIAHLAKVHGIAPPKLP